MTQIRELSQPLADIYAQLTDDLMANIAQMLATHGEITDTAKWKIQKLSQLGELNEKNIKAIAKATGICPKMAEAAIKNAAFEAASEIEPTLHKAAAMGFFAHVSDMAASKRIMNTLATYQKQAVVSFNLVNTVMAYKAKDAYTGIVNKAADLANREEYLQILGKNTASVVTGTQSRTAALRQCIKEFSEKGLPGFVDKSGREWSPEAYINMDIRTTVNNVAHQAQFDRMDDYGCDLIEVSSHIGARPLCAPYQGKLYSRSGKDGYTTDLNGQKIRYTAWAATTYGQPAGLLGINCSHHVYPFIPGYSRMTYQPYDKETNDKVYQESQRQRCLERKVRESKRECAMLDKLGDKEGFDKAAERLKQREQTLKQYTQETGRARKRDREQVNGFDRRVSKQAIVSNQLKTSRNNANIKSVTDARDMAQKIFAEAGIKGKQIDEIANVLHRVTGFGGLPKLFKTPAFEQAAQGKEILYRGFRGNEEKSAAQFADQYRKGKLFNGTGVYGRGTYTTSHLDKAIQYSDGTDGSVMRLLLADDAKIIKLSELEKLRRAYAKTAGFNDTLPETETIKYIFGSRSMVSLGHVAEAMGYDAVKVDIGGNDHIIILNRTKVFVEVLT